MSFHFLSGFKRPAVPKDCPKQTVEFQDDSGAQRTVEVPYGLSFLAEFEIAKLGNFVARSTVSNIQREYLVDLPAAGEAVRQRGRELVAKKERLQILAETAAKKGKKQTVDLSATVGILSEGREFLGENLELEVRKNELKGLITNSVKLQKTKFWRSGILKELAKRDSLPNLSEFQKFTEFLKLMVKIWGDNTAHTIVKQTAEDYFKSQWNDFNFETQDLANTVKSRLGSAVNKVPEDYKTDVIEAGFATFMVKIAQLSISDSKKAHELIEKIQLEDIKGNLKCSTKVEIAFMHLKSILREYNELNTFYPSSDNTLEKKLNDFLKKVTRYAVNADRQASDPEVQVYLTNIGLSLLELIKKQPRFTKIEYQRPIEQALAALNQSKHYLFGTNSNEIKTTLGIGVEASFTQEHIDKILKCYQELIVKNIHDVNTVAKIIDAARETFSKVTDAKNPDPELLKKAKIAHAQLQQAQNFSEYLGIEDQIEDDGIGPAGSVYQYSRYINTPAELVEKGPYLAKALQFVEEALQEVSQKVPKGDYRKQLEKELRTKQDQIKRAQQALAHEMFLLVKDVCEKSNITEVSVTDDILKELVKLGLLKPESYAKYIKLNDLIRNNVSLVKPPLGQGLFLQFYSYITQYADASIADQLDKLRFPDSILQSGANRALPPVIPFVTHGQVNVPRIPGVVDLTQNDLVSQTEPWFPPAKNRFWIIQDSKLPQFNKLLQQIHLALNLNNKNQPLESADKYVVLASVFKAHAIIDEERRKLASTFTRSEFDIEYKKVLVYAENELKKTAHQLSGTIVARLIDTFALDKSFLMSADSLRTYKDFVAIYGKQVNIPNYEDGMKSDYDAVFTKQTKFIEDFLTNLKEKKYITQESAGKITINFNTFLNQYQITHDADLCERFHLQADNARRANEIKAIKLLTSIVVGHPDFVTLGIKSEPGKIVTAEDLIKIVMNLPGYDEVSANTLLTNAVQDYVVNQDLINLTDTQVEVMRSFAPGKWTLYDGRKNHANGVLVQLVKGLYHGLTVPVNKDNQEKLKEINKDLEGIPKTRIFTKNPPRRQASVATFPALITANAKELLEAFGVVGHNDNNSLSPEFIQQVSRLLSFSTEFRELLIKGRKEGDKVKWKEVQRQKTQDEKEKFGLITQPGLLDIRQEIETIDDIRLPHLERIILNFKPASNSLLAAYRTKIIELYFLKSGQEQGTKEIGKEKEVVVLEGESLQDRRNLLLPTLPCHFDENQIIAIKAIIEKPGIARDHSLLRLVRDVINCEIDKDIRNTLLKRLKFSVIRSTLRDYATREAIQKLSPKEEDINRAVTAKRSELGAAQTVNLFSQKEIEELCKQELIENELAKRVAGLKQALEGINPGGVYTEQEKQELIELLRLKGTIIRSPLEQISGKLGTEIKSYYGGIIVKSTHEIHAVLQDKSAHEIEAELQAKLQNLKETLQDSYPNKELEVKLGDKKETDKQITYQISTNCGSFDITVYKREHKLSKFYEYELNDNSGQTLALDEVSRVSRPALLDLISDNLPSGARKAAVHTLCIALMRPDPVSGNIATINGKRTNDGSYKNKNLEFIRKAIVDSQLQGVNNYFNAEQQATLMDALTSCHSGSDFNIWPLLQIFVAPLFQNEEDVSLTPGGALTPEGKKLAAAYCYNRILHIIYHPDSSNISSEAEDRDHEFLVLKTIYDKCFSRKMKLEIYRLAREQQYSPNENIRCLLLSLDVEADAALLAQTEEPPPVADVIRSQATTNVKARVNTLTRSAITWLQENDLFNNAGNIERALQDELDNLIGKDINQEIGMADAGHEANFSYRDAMFGEFLNEFISIFDGVLKADVLKFTEVDKVLHKAIPMVVNLLPQVIKGMSDRSAKDIKFLRQHQHETHFLRNICHYLNSVDHAELISRMNPQEAEKYTAFIKKVFSACQTERAKTSLPLIIATQLQDEKLQQSLAVATAGTQPSIASGDLTATINQVELVLREVNQYTANVEATISSKLPTLIPPGKSGQFSVPEVKALIQSILDSSIDIFNVNRDRLFALPLANDPVVGNLMRAEESYVFAAFRNEIDRCIEKLAENKENLTVEKAKEILRLTSESMLSAISTLNNHQIERYYGQQGYMTYMTVNAIDGELKRAVAKHITQKCAKEIMREDDVAFKQEIKELMPQTDVPSLSDQFLEKLNAGWGARPVLQIPGWTQSPRGEIYPSAQAAWEYLESNIPTPRLDSSPLDWKAQRKNDSNIAQAVVDWIYCMSKQLALGDDSATKPFFIYFIARNFPNVNVVNISPRELLLRLLEKVPSSIEGLLLAMQQTNNKEYVFSDETIVWLRNVLQHQADELESVVNNAKGNALRLYQVVAQQDESAKSHQQKLFNDLTTYIQMFLNRNEFDRARDLALDFIREVDMRIKIASLFQAKFDNLLNNADRDNISYVNFLELVFVSNDLQNLSPRRQLQQQLLQQKLGLHCIAKIGDQLSQAMQANNIAALKSSLKSLLIAYTYINRLGDDVLSTSVFDKLLMLLDGGFSQPVIEVVNHLIVDAAKSQNSDYRDAAVNALFEIGQRVDNHINDLSNDIRKEEQVIANINAPFEQAAVNFLPTVWVYEVNRAQPSAPVESDLYVAQQAAFINRATLRSEEIRAAGFTEKDSNIVALENPTAEQRQKRAELVRIKLNQIGLQFRVLDQLFFDMYDGVESGLQSNIADEKLQALAKVHAIYNVASQWKHKSKKIQDLQIRCNQLLKEHHTTVVDRSIISKNQTTLDQQFAKLKGNDDLDQLSTIWKLARVGGDVTARQEFYEDTQRLQALIIEPEQRKTALQSKRAAPLAYQSGVQSFIFVAKNMVSAIQNKVVAMVNWFWTRNTQSENAQTNGECVAALRAHFDRLLSTKDTADAQAIIQTYENTTLDTGVKKQIEGHYIAAIDRQFNNGIVKKSWASVIAIALKAYAANPRENKFFNAIQSQIEKAFALQAKPGEPDEVYFKRVVEGIKLLAELYKLPDYEKNSVAKRFTDQLKPFIEGFLNRVDYTNSTDRKILTVCMRSLYLFLPSTEKDENNKFRVSPLAKVLLEKVINCQHKLFEQQNNIQIALQFSWSFCPTWDEIQNESIWLDSDQRAKASKLNSKFSQIMKQRFPARLPADIEKQMPNIRIKLLNYYGPEEAYQIITKKPFDVENKKTLSLLDSMIDNLDSAYILQNTFIAQTNTLMEGNARSELFEHVYRDIENNITKYRCKTFLENLDKALSKAEANPKAAQELYDFFEPATNACLKLLKHDLFKSDQKTQKENQFVHVKLHYCVVRLMELDKQTSKQELTPDVLEAIDRYSAYIMRYSTDKSQKEFAQNLVQKLLEPKAEGKAVQRSAFGRFFTSGAGLRKPIPASGSFVSTPSSSAKSSPKSTPLATPTASMRDIHIASGSGSRLPGEPPAPPPLPATPRLGKRSPKGVTPPGTPVRKASDVHVSSSSAGISAAATPAIPNDKAGAVVRAHSAPQIPVASSSPSSVASNAAVHGMLAAPKPSPVGVSSFEELFPKGLIPAIPNGRCGYYSIALLIGAVAVEYQNDPRNREIDAFLHRVYEVVKNNKIFGQTTFEGFCTVLANHMKSKSDQGRIIIQDSLWQPFFKLAQQEIDSGKAHFLKNVELDIVALFDTFARKAFDVGLDAAREFLNGELTNGELREQADLRQIFQANWDSLNSNVIQKDPNNKKKIYDAIHEHAYQIGVGFEKNKGAYWKRRRDSNWLGQFEIDKLGEKLGVKIEIWYGNREDPSTLQRIPCGQQNAAICLPVFRKDLHYDAYIEQYKNPRPPAQLVVKS